MMAHNAPWMPAAPGQHGWKAGDARKMARAHTSRSHTIAGCMERMGQGGSQGGSSAPSRCSNGEQSSQQKSIGPDSVTILVSNLPKSLCTRKCFEAVVEAAGLDKVIHAFEVLGDNAEAVLGVAGETGAQRCIKYFNGLKWAKSTQPVSARYCAKARKYLEKEENPQPEELVKQDCGKGLSSDMLLANEGNAQQVNEHNIAQLTKDRLPASVANSLQGKTDGIMDFTKEFAVTTPNKGQNRAVGQFGTHPRWADYDDDEDECQSTLAGTVIDNCGISDGGETGSTIDDFEVNLITS